MPKGTGSRSFGKASVRDAEVDGRRVLLRADLNVPLQRGGVADDTGSGPRSRQSSCFATAASIVLVSHLGRPKGPDPDFSMGPVGKRLGELLGAEVKQAPAVVGGEVSEMASGLSAEVLLLENSRFEAGRPRTIRNSPRRSPIWWIST